MRYTLIDRILALEAGKRLTARKNLALSEEYLADHFPHAPVMPGVLMLEALTQAAAWLVRHTDGFAHSMVLLKEARSVKYANFVEPGKSLEIVAELLGQDERHCKLKAQGTIDGEVAVSARLVLERFNLAPQGPHLEATDRFLLSRLREQFAVLYRTDLV